MSFWDSLKFGTHAISLEMMAAESPDQIAAVQRDRLKELLRYVRENSAFYRDKFASIEGGSFQLADLPITTKGELMEHFDEAVTVRDVRRAEIEKFLANGANLGKLFHDRYVVSHTSGSQGQPLLLVQSIDDVELMFALQASRGNHESLGMWEAARRMVTPARLATVTLQPGFYPSAVAFEYMPESVSGFIKLLRVSLTDRDMLARLEAFRPTHLTAYASILHELARHLEEGRLTLKPDLEQVVNISERLMPQTREHYETLFGAKFLDDYAMGECMFLTNGCPTSGGMHVNADWAILEVVDQHNRPVGNGQKGAKVLITNLANRVQPIIRYEIGDVLSMATEPCGCGSNLPLIARIEGRDSDMFYVEEADGMRPLSPAILEFALGQLLDVREYQFVQEALDRICIRIEPLPGMQLDRADAERVVRKQLDSYHLGDKLQIEIDVVDRLAANHDNKFKRVVNKMGKPATVVSA